MRFAPSVLLLLALGSLAGAQATAPRTVPAGDTLRATVSVLGRTLDIRGVVDGDAIAVGGDVVVHPEGRVLGNATAVGGQVRAAAGSITGTRRSLGLSKPAASAPAERDTSHALKVVLGWFAVLAVIGIGVLLFAEGTMAGVTEGLERQFGRSFWYGLLAQLALLPTLLIIVAALTLTVVGVLLVPFAIVAYAIVAMGFMTLGFLAVARFTGAGFRRGATRTADRASHVSALLRGLLVYLAPFVLAALLTTFPLASAVLGSVALAISWVAVTLGFGAAIAARVDARRSGARPAPSTMDPLVWQTPTPVTGVAAARRQRTTVSS